jgi:hypothetical protein
MCGRTRGSAWRCEKTNSSPGLKTLCIRSVDLELVYGDPHLGAAPPSGACGACGEAWPSSANFPFFFSFGWTGGVKLPHTADFRHRSVTVTGSRSL